MLSLLTHLLLYSWAEPNSPTSPRLRLRLPGGPPYLDHMVLAAVCGFHPWDPSLPFTPLPSSMAHLLPGVTAHTPSGQGTTQGRN